MLFSIQSNLIRLKKCLVMLLNLYIILYYIILYPGPSLELSFGSLSLLLSSSLVTKKEREKKKSERDKTERYRERKRDIERKILFILRHREKKSWTRRKREREKVWQRKLNIFRDTLYIYFMLPMYTDTTGVMYFTEWKNKRKTNTFREKSSVY